MTGDPLFELEQHLVDAHALETAAAWRTYNLWMVAHAVSFLVGIAMVMLSAWMNPPMHAWLLLASVLTLGLSARLWFKANRARAAWWTLFRWEDDAA